MMDHCSGQVPVAPFGPSAAPEFAGQARHVLCHTRVITSCKRLQSLQESGIFSGKNFMNNINELKNTGLKATLPRLKILEIFQAGKQRHMTAEDVFRVLLEDRSDIGLATVYRVLTQFEQAGLVNRSNFESGKAVFELNEGQHHDHLVCLDCSKVEEFHDVEIEKRQHAVAKAKGFTIADHSLSIYANCIKESCPNRALGIGRHHHV